MLIANADKKALSIVKNAEESARALIKLRIRLRLSLPQGVRLEKKPRSHFHKIEKSVLKREEKKIIQQSVAAKKRPLKEGDAVG